MNATGSSAAAVVPPTPTTPNATPRISASPYKVLAPMIVLRRSPAAPTPDARTPPAFSFPALAKMPALLPGQPARGLPPRAHRLPPLPLPPSTPTLPAHTPRNPPPTAGTTHAKTKHAFFFPAKELITAIRSSGAARPRTPSAMKTLAFRYPAPAKTPATRHSAAVPQPTRFARSMPVFPCPAPAPMPVLLPPTVSAHSAAMAASIPAKSATTAIGVAATDARSTARMNRKSSLRRSAGTVS